MAKELIITCNFLDLMRAYCGETFSKEQLYYQATQDAFFNCKDNSPITRKEWEFFKNKNVEIHVLKEPYHGYSELQLHFRFPYTQVYKGDCMDIKELFSELIAVTFNN